MEATPDIVMWLIICGVGFLAGFIDAIAGGGGMLTIPTLLATGLPPHVALGTNKLAASFGSFTASIAFYRKKLFNPIFWRHSLIFTAVGAIIGTLVVSAISTDWLEKALPIIILITAIYTFVIKPPTSESNTLPKPSSKLKTKQAAQGLTLGFYDGVAGPGTGTFWTASSISLYKLNMLTSLGLAKSCNFVSNFMSLLMFVYLGHINIFLGLALGFCIMIGAWVGAHSAIKFGAKFIRPVFVTVVIIMSIHLAFKAWLS